MKTHEIFLKILNSKITYILTTATVVFSITVYFSGQKVEALINKYEMKLLICENEISSINRALQSDEDAIFNVSNVFISRNSNLISSNNLIYQSDAEFYFSSDSSYWNYENTKRLPNPLLEIIDTLYRFKGKLSRALSKRNYPMHYWEGKDYLLFDLNLKNGNIERVALPPTIVFQKMSMDSLVEIGYSLTDSALSKHSYSTEYKRMRFPNIIYSVITNLSDFTNDFDNAYFELVDIQKENDLLYIRAINTFDNSGSNGKVNKVYLHWEFIFLVKENYFYIIQIINPTLDRLSNNAEIMKWLNNLKIII